MVCQEIFVSANYSCSQPSLCTLRILLLLIFNFGATSRTESFSVPVADVKELKAKMQVAVCTETEDNTFEPRYPDTRFSRHSAYHVSFSKSRFSVYDFNVKKKLRILRH